VNTLNKGKLGELAVQKCLVEQGYNIYTPVVDSNQVDLVVELSSGAMKRVQIKTVTELKRGTAVEVNLTKYKNRNRIDVVAVYYLPKDIIAYCPYDNSHQLSLALSTGKNNQTKGRKWFYSYDQFPEFS
jgi:Holliday junction resolvase-like predicted endonuclease